MSIDVQQILAKFPSHIQKPNGEYAMPCPYCGEEHPLDAQDYEGQLFSGDDRFVWFAGYKGFYCRSCASENRGGEGKSNGYYPRHEVVEKLFGIVIEVSEEDIEEEVTEKPLRMLWSGGRVKAAHKEVDREYWHKVGFTDAMIDRFMLGKGTLYTRNLNQHLIPMRLTRVESVEDEVEDISHLYYMSSRPAKERTPGSSKPYMWHISDDPTSTTIVIAEGEKDGISAWLYHPNVAVAFGVNHWTKQKSEFLRQQGYQHVIIASDRDEAGTTFSHTVAGWCQDVGLTVERLIWDKDNEETRFAKDITDVLGILGEDNYKTWFKEHLQDAEKRASAGGVTKARPFDVTDETDVETGNTETTETVSITTLREELGQEISGFLDEYSYKRGAGKIQLLAAPPGAGKTHALIKKTEEIAERAYNRKQREFAHLKANIESIRLQLEDDAFAIEEREALQNRLKEMEGRLETFSFNSIAWFGPFKDGWGNLLATGADPEMWFNYKARSNENCDNFEMVEELGRKNHDIGTYCQLACPFRQKCRQSGYLRQEVDKLKKPITYYRHHHLLGDSFTQGYDDAIIIDEYAGTVYENGAVFITDKNLSAGSPGWELTIEYRESIEAIDALVQAVKMLMASRQGIARRLPDHSENFEYVLSGGRLLERLNSLMLAYSSGRISLKHAVTELLTDDVLDQYQPNYLSSEIKVKLPSRVVPHLVKTIRQELDTYDGFEYDKPTCIHMVGSNYIEVYPVQRVTIPARVPIVVADATALPELYKAIFSKREVEMYRPALRNENAKVTVVNGNDWTNMSLQRSAGKLIALHKRAQRKVALSDGSTLDVTGLPQTLVEEMKRNKLLAKADKIIQKVTSKHDSVLIVTHKKLRELLESFMDASQSLQGDGEKRIAFGHYGSLRGSNAYKDYEAAILIGAFRIPYDILWRRIQMWAFLLGLQDEIPKETVIKDAVYHNTDKGYGYRTFDHWFADAFVTMVEAGELRQTANRIRPHSQNNNKHIYIFASRPAILYVDNVVHENSFLADDSEHIQAEAWMREMLAENGKLPSYRAIRDKFTISNKIIKQLRAKIETEDLL
jgi:hypothetical protein